MVVFDSKRESHLTDAHLQHISPFMRLLAEYSPNFSGDWPWPTWGCMRAAER